MDVKRRVMEAMTDRVIFLLLSVLGQVKELNGMDWKLFLSSLY